MMSPSSTHDLSWDNSGDILQGIMGSRVAPSSDGVPPSDFALGDPASASFLGFQFGPEPILPHWPPYHPQSSSSSVDYPQFRHPRMTNDQDAWNPLQVTGVPTNPPAVPISHLGKSQPVPSLDRRYSIGQYSTPSENGSQYNGIHPSDSGYSSHSCATRSVATTTSYAIDSACSPCSGPPEQEQDDRASMLDLNPVDQPPLLCPDVIRCDYPGCRWTGKCPSDKRKHEARHRKLFKCDEPNCTRKEGFGTINDLARHKKCVHKQEPERGPKVLYMCFGQDCPRQNKKWPRLDNFRQHLARMHTDEDTDELLRKSHDWYENCIKPQELAHLEGTIPFPTPVPGFRHDPPPEHGHVAFRVPETHTPSLPDRSISSPFNHIQSHAAPQHLELPLKALSLNSLNHDTLTAATPLSHKNDRVEEMVNEAATNMINAMTKMINTNQRRRSHPSNDPDDLEGNAALTGQKKEMLQRILSAALERLSGNGPNPSPGLVPHDAPDEGSDKRGWIQCEFCTKRTRLRCEMKKHKKRHERPYGCTFDRCNKTFGSKADWKRHENSQHFHLQSWRCTMHGDEDDASSAGRPCARLFYRQEVYVQHLRKVHHADDAAVRDALCRNRMGRNGQSRFWCGFCRDIVPLKSQGIDAWNERFNHIDAEHFKKGERIADWLLPEGHLTKAGEREEELRRGGGVARDDVGADADADADAVDDEENSDDDSERSDSVLPSDSEGGFVDEALAGETAGVSTASRKRKLAVPCAEHDAKRCKAVPAFAGMQMQMEGGLNVLGRWTEGELLPRGDY
ncbi:hypothetical protein BDV59DRAFT_136847 [Aspergillus ambiguus]|uniref:putative C2H2 finger domain protein n=1 Tax=Aspergillus ambiguus TaxID=176160 RepID=UPI003CCCF7CB